MAQGTIMAGRTGASHIKKLLEEARAEARGRGAGGLTPRQADDFKRRIDAAAELDKAELLRTELGDRLQSVETAERNLEILEARKAGVLKRIAEMEA